LSQANEEKVEQEMKVEQQVEEPSKNPKERIYTFAIVPKQTSPNKPVTCNLFSLCTKPKDRTYAID
jgi:hypothetical protein